MMMKLSNIAGLTQLKGKISDAAYKDVLTELARVVSVNKEITAKIEDQF